MATYNITLACAFGASTSNIVKKMREVADENNIDADIQAIPTTEAIKRVSEFSIILLGPQVRYELKRFKKEADKFDIPVIDIPSDLYGDNDGKSILALALKTLMNK
ncbi:PTS sugar transporter subunit IIB [Mesoplasma photuris]|uniref:PTS sugar transporter subunit IIB n=1 Tax=Mesoplasma photuris TaxID=217731 RepID=UPI0004E1E85F|nr:PTS sugar transporter subunit IIB [Mesoplasma photuris]